VHQGWFAPLIGSQPTSRVLSRDDAVALARQSVVVVYVESDEAK
jgi:hypothetical protein